MIVHDSESIEKFHAMNFNHFNIYSNENRNENTTQRRPTFLVGVLFGMWLQHFLQNWEILFTFVSHIP